MGFQFYVKLICPNKTTQSIYSGLLNYSRTVKKMFPHFDYSSETASFCRCPTSHRTLQFIFTWNDNYISISHEQSRISDREKSCLHFFANNNFRAWPFTIFVISTHEEIIHVVCSHISKIPSHTTACMLPMIRPHHEMEINVHGGDIHRHNLPCVFLEDWSPLQR